MAIIHTVKDKNNKGSSGTDLLGVLPHVVLLTIGCMEIHSTIQAKHSTELV